MSLKTKLKYTGIITSSFFLGLLLQTTGLRGLSILFPTILPTIIYWNENQDNLSDRRTRYKLYTGIIATIIGMILLAITSMITYSI